jgi:hypothetical protein
VVGFPLYTTPLVMRGARRKANQQIDLIRGDEMR